MSLVIATVASASLGAFLLFLETGTTSIPHESKCALLSVVWDQSAVVLSWQGTSLVALALGAGLLARLRVLRWPVRGLASLMVLPGLVRLDFDYGCLLTGEELSEGAVGQIGFMLLSGGVLMSTFLKTKRWSHSEATDALET